MEKQKEGGGGGYGGRKTKERGDIVEEERHTPRQGGGDSHRLHDRDNLSGLAQRRHFRSVLTGAVQGQARDVLHMDHHVFGRDIFVFGRHLRRDASD